MTPIGRLDLRAGDLIETPSGARFEVIAPGAHHYDAWSNAWVRTRTGNEFHMTIWPDRPYTYRRPT